MFSNAFLNCIHVLPPRPRPTLGACPAHLLDDMVGHVFRQHRRFFVGDLSRFEDISPQLQGRDLCREAESLALGTLGVIRLDSEALVICPSFVLEGMIEVIRDPDYIIGRLRMECGYVALATGGLVKLPRGRNRDYPAGFVFVVDDPFMSVDAPEPFSLTIADIHIDTGVVPEPHFSRWRAEQPKQLPCAFSTTRRLCAW
ncbi:MAG: hypothetical protein ACOCXA_01685 [Planctomycetota bacterium]